MLMLKEKVILVDERDREIGSEEKLRAHRKGGKLHRALSVFIFNSNGELLIQKRAKEKYHSGGLWSNTCCSHPRSGESTKEAAQRRLKEEMGFTTDLEEKFSFIYRVNVENGLTEWEFDHIFFGRFDGKPSPVKKEVSDWKWVSLQDLKKDKKENPKKYGSWFKVILEKLDYGE